MKYKLPEDFKLIKNHGNGNLISIYHKARDAYGYADSLRQASVLISKYRENLELIKNTILPCGYDLVMYDNDISDKLSLYYNDEHILSSDKIQILLDIANKTTELDLQIKALNEGKEIEL